MSNHSRTFPRTFRDILRVPRDIFASFPPSTVVQAQRIMLPVQIVSTTSNAKPMQNGCENEVRGRKGWQVEFATLHFAALGVMFETQGRRHVSQERAKGTQVVPLEWHLVPSGIQRELPNSHFWQ